MQGMEKLEGMDGRYLAFGLLFAASNRLETAGDRYLQELTAKQWYLLLCLTTFFERPPTLSQLAGQMGSSRQNVKQLALKLEKKGFVALVRDESDRRALRVAPTERLEEYRAQRQEQDGAFVEELFAGVAPADLAAANRLLLALCNRLEEMER